ncbi:MAG: glycosyltransferase [Alphaproteobacteria bacterium]|nr:glycosyltransferase [Alphaproteobacteria bacterium]
MTWLDAFAPSFVVLGFYIAIAPLLPRERTWARSLVLGIATLVTLRYLDWRLEWTMDFDRATGIQAAWMLIYLVVEIAAFAEVALGHFILTRRSNRTPEADVHERRLRATPAANLPSVDIFIATYNEEVDILERTIVGALNLDYPNFKVWVLDDGRREWLRDFCAERDVGYLIRPDNKHHKAGNINHALRHTSGDLVAIFDADFVPNRKFLIRTVGFFQDPKIGCVQTPHHFFNKDPIQSNLKITDLWPDEQRLFFDAVLPRRHAWDVAFNCGSGAISRREAFTAIGGMPTESITEDMLPTLVQLRHGWITRYLDEQLSLGLAPESVNAYFVQRHRWCRGQIQTMFLKMGPFGPGLTLLQRLFFIPAYWFVQLPSRLFMMTVPLVFLWFDLAPFDIGSVEMLISQTLPLIIAHIAAMRWVASRSFMPFLTTASNLFTAIRVTPKAVASLIKPFGVGFKVTPKGFSNQQLVYDRVTAAVSLAGLALAVGGIWINLDVDLRVIENRLNFATAVVWALLNAIAFVIVLMMSLEAPRFRQQERFVLDAPSQFFTGGLRAPVTIVDLSFRGARIAFGNHPVPAIGAQVAVDIGTMGLLWATVRWRRHDEASVSFDDSPGVADRLRLSLRRSTMAKPRPNERRQAPRARLDLPATCIVGAVRQPCRIVDASTSGAAVTLDDGVTLEAGQQILLDIPSVGVVAGQMVRISGGRGSIRFEDIGRQTRDRLMQRLYTEGLSNNASGAVAPGELISYVVG